MKFDFLFKQALFATGFLISTVLFGQAQVSAVTPEAEQSQKGLHGAIALTQTPKNWENTDLVTTPAAPTSATVISQSFEPPQNPPIDVTPETGVMDESAEPVTPMEPGLETLPEAGLSEEAITPTPAEPPAPFALDEDSSTAVDLVPPNPQDPPSLNPSDNNSLDILQLEDGTEVAQDVQTRYRFSYIGIGPNVGITGDSAIGDTSFAIVSRFSVTPRFSARPALFIEDDVSILLPVTYDFPISGPGNVAPYVGGGLSIDTGDGDAVNLLLSAGLDIPLNDNFAVTTGVNATPFDEFDLGLHFAIAYTFGESTTTVDPVDAAAIEAEVTENAAELGLEGRGANPSFIGAGANLGIGGDTALGETSFAVVSKITIASSASVRPSLLIEDGVTLLLPVTYDFAGFSTEFISFYPFIGAGAAISFDDEDSEFDLLLTAGVDVPITSNLALTSSLNAGLFDSFDIGVLLGVVYTFSSF